MRYIRAALPLVIPVLASLCSFDLSAQIPEWVVAPGIHKIEKYSDNTYLIKDAENKSWLINEEGNRYYDPLVENSFILTYDSISPVIGGYGLLMDYEFPKSAWRLRGIFDKNNKTVKNFSEKEKYYIDEYGFFAEKMLPVRKDNKKYGYLNPLGIPVTKFNYEIALPFSEGKAAVAKGRIKKTPMLDFFNTPGNDTYGNFLYVDYFGNEINLPAAIGKSSMLCTTFHGGEATLVTDKGTAMRIDERLAPLNTVDVNSVKIDEVGINIGMTPDDIVLGLPDPIIVDTTDIEIFTEKELIGYKRGGKILLPAQFLSGDQFDGEYAIVNNESGTGMIRLLPDTLNITISESKEKNPIDSLENLIIRFPSRANLVKKFILYDLNGDGILYDVLGDKEIGFTMPLAHNVRLHLEGEYGLVLADTILETPGYRLAEEKKKEEEMIEKSDMAVTISPLAVTANAKMQASVNVKVTNNTSTTKTFSVTISGTKLSGGTYKVKLAPGKSKFFSPVFTKIVRKEKRNISVNAGGKIVTKTIQVIPKAVSL